MRPAVRDQLKSFTTKFEGSLSFMYLDQEGYVTTNIGNKIDPVDQALALTWLTAAGTTATPEEVTAEWNNIKSHTELESQGGGAYGKIATLHLSADSQDSLFWATYGNFESTLKGRYPHYDDWPADAQLGVLSMAWAMGPAFDFPAFDAAVNSDPPDFATAATQSQMKPTPGIAPRNAADLLLFQNAAKVQSGNGDPDKLWWPDTAPDDGGAPATLPAGGTTVAAKAMGIAGALLVAGGAWMLVHYVIGPRLARSIAESRTDRDHTESLLDRLDAAEGGAPA